MKIIKLMIIFIIITPLSVFTDSKYADLTNLNYAFTVVTILLLESELTECLEEIFHTSQAVLDKSLQEFF